ncbi:MAG: PHP domain-containing protein [Syntrophomonas sp.]|uniref:PHP domain-containing protein n=1 Tax=Syntrophomonas sp. TaxID=2053627 RepID=UPI0026371FA0|nr:PHP domain-containing protein [Syntrophomonas sp.]MDD2509710.1 PHP domain-containing protein [Syntrophomonas sp.]MDD3879405.1 PHP domain-containing protein [Syntrophomonas sp.]MDD4625842.1 PHP domain-containing protein [Syntrophomonas sp.]
MLYDLHTHTTASDGLLSPTELLGKASEMRLPGLAITDHDTIDGLEEARRFIAENSLALDFVPGIELNTELTEKEIHILGYFIDYHDHRLLGRLQEIKEARLERARKMINRLVVMGLNIDLDQVKRLAQGDLIARPHIAQALMENSYVFSVKEAFDKYIGKGRPAYVNRYKFLPEEAIALINEAGGIAVLAHPGLIRNDSLVEDIIALGIEGIEVFYPEHNHKQILKYSAFCQQHQLLITGGSDFHGYGKEEGRGKFGSFGVSREKMQNIFDYQQNRSKKQARRT